MINSIICLIKGHKPRTELWWKEIYFIDNSYSITSSDPHEYITNCSNTYTGYCERCKKLLSSKQIMKIYSKQHKSMPKVSLYCLMSGDYFDEYKMIKD